MLIRLFSIKNIGYPEVKSKPVGQLIESGLDSENAFLAKVNKKYEAANKVTNFADFNLGFNSRILKFFLERRSSYRALFAFKELEKQCR